MAQVMAPAMALAMAPVKDGEMTYHHSTPLHCLFLKFRVKSRSDSLRNFHAQIHHHHASLERVGRQ